MTTRNNARLGYFRSRSWNAIMFALTGIAVPFYAIEQIQTRCRDCVPMWLLGCAVVVHIGVWWTLSFRAGWLGWALRRAPVRVVVAVGSAAVIYVSMIALVAVSAQGCTE